MKKIRRIQDLESQSLGKFATLEDAVDAMAEVYLEKKDLVRKAERLSNARAPKT